MHGYLGACQTINLHDKYVLLLQSDVHFGSRQYKHSPPSNSLSCTWYSCMVLLMQLVMHRLLWV